MSAERHIVYRSLTPAKRLAIAAIALAGAAMFCFMLTDNLHVFKPCRALYLKQNALQDSVLCHVHSGIQYFGILLFAVFVVLVGLSLLVWMRTPQVEHHHHEH